MLSIKKYYYLTFVCSLAFLFVSCSAKTKNKIKEAPEGQPKVESKQKNISVENSPQIVIDSPQFDVGDVFEGDDLLHSFIVKNTGGGILNIKNVKPG